MPQGKSLKEDNKEKIDISIALLVVLAAIWFIYHFTFCATFGVEEMSDLQLLSDNRQSIEFVEVESKRYQPVVNGFEGKVKIVAPEKIENVAWTNITSTNPIDTSIHSSVEHLIEPEQILVEDTLALEVKSNDEYVGRNVDTLHSGFNTLTKVDSSSLVETKEPNISPSIENNEVKPNSDCIIVIGAYGVRSNRIAMEKKLEKAGYDVFVTPYRGLSRVGIYQPCQVDKITETLKVVRKRFAKDATILTAE